MWFALIFSLPFLLLLTLKKFHATDIEKYGNLRDSHINGSVDQKETYPIPRV